MTLAAFSAAMAAVAVSTFTELYARVMVSSASSPYALRVMTVVLAAPGAGRPGIEPDGQR
ncbi:hypothetical protein FHX44_11926 [Pseudonocardia hierapolitana]|uniref:Uncharacterized protein n=1 Tax=Pseudonocardia hierapolitana TaxID=1128676 RepID=A0A561SJN9_9PSEU|nr:hypothetical protein [Pseudonocardia hierapolitana]TWF75042.1 hypothetical protein FHX44_11926 [Pseudonocardia hierapolitana]